MKRPLTKDRKELKRRLRVYLENNDGHLQTLFIMCKYDLRNIMRDLGEPEWSTISSDKAIALLLDLGYPIDLLPDPEMFNTKVPISILGSMCKLPEGFFKRFDEDKQSQTRGAQSF